MSREEELKKLLTSYVRAEMDQIQPEEMDGYDHEFSSRHRKKIQKVLRGGKGFLKRISMGHAARRAAAAALIIVSLLSVTQISARIFGFRPWNYNSSFEDEYIMDKKEYLGPNENISIDDENLLKVIKEVPDDIPEGFVQKKVKDGIVSLSAEWERPDHAQIRYCRINLTGSMSMWVNSECSTKERVSIAGYEGYCYAKDMHAWFQWDDTMYCHWLDISGTENAKDELVKIAWSLYQQPGE